jgi:hypothetical protein
VENFSQFAVASPFGVHISAMQHNMVIYYVNQPVKHGHICMDIYMVLNGDGLYLFFFFQLGDAVENMNLCIFVENMEKACYILLTGESIPVPDRSYWLCKSACQ